MLDGIAMFRPGTRKLSKQTHKLFKPPSQPFGVSAFRHHSTAMVMISVIFANGLYFVTSNTF